MKMHGKIVQVPIEEVIVIPRETGDLVFKARPVIDWDKHTALDPKPEPPVIKRPGQPDQKNVEHPKYKKKFNAWAERRWSWMTLESLSATEGLEFETVKMEDPETWINWKDEMASAGLVLTEIARIEELVLVACRLDQTKIDRATEAFLAEQARIRSQESSPSSEHSDTTSGELASVSV